MTGPPPTLFDRLRALLARRRSPRVLVLVNTVRGPQAVAMTADELDRLPRR